MISFSSNNNGFGGGGGGQQRPVQQQQQQSLMGMQTTPMPLMIGGSDGGEQQQQQKPPLMGANQFKGYMNRLRQVGGGRGGGMMGGGGMGGAGGQMMRSRPYQAPPAPKARVQGVFCECCNIMLNSAVIYESHCKGAKHLKRLTQVNSILSGNAAPPPAKQPTTIGGAGSAQVQFTFCRRLYLLFDLNS